MVNQEEITKLEDNLEQVTQKYRAKKKELDAKNEEVSTLVAEKDNLLFEVQMRDRKI